MDRELVNTVGLSTLIVVAVALVWLAIAAPPTSMSMSKAEPVETKKECVEHIVVAIGGACVSSEHDLVFLGNKHVCKCPVKRDRRPACPSSNPIYQKM